MRLDKFTVKAQEALQVAQSMADQHDHQAIEPEHLLVALLEQREGVVGPVLAKLGARPEAIQRELQAALGKLATVKGTSGHYLGERTRQALDRAQAEAGRLKDEYVSTEHLLLALAQERDGATGRVLTANGVSAEAIYKALVEIRGTQRVTDPNPEEKYQALLRYSRDLTDLARRGKLDPVIGRDAEIRRVIQVLSRRTKNNPGLIGDPRVGKTAIVEGLAQRIVAGDVPEGLNGKRGWALAIGAGLAGSKYRGELEGRVKALLTQGLKERYEAHHGVRIRDAALVAAAVLSDRYISDRQLPDKAIDLVDEAASRLRMEIDSSPLELDEAERRVRQLEIELAAMGKESKDVREPLERELAGAHERRNELAARWSREKEQLERVKEITRKIDELRGEAERAERNGELQRVAEIRYGELPELERELEARDVPENPMVKEEVDEDDVAAVVARWTGIPVDKLLEGETEKLIHMEERLHQRVVGQDEAVEAVANALRRARTGLQDPNRPIGSFVFLGPTGVGKTEVGRALAEFMFDDERALVRLDMSEYQERHTVARLIGAPPGYVGDEGGGQLTEAGGPRPESVILFDEIEKAHHDVFNVLLQLLDDGRLTDGHGRTVDFKNTVVIMTSNVGSQLLTGYRGDDPAAYDAMKQEVLEALRQHFRPEFLNRVDDVVVFHPLGRSHLRQIVDIQLARLQARLVDRHLELVFTDRAKDFLAERGFDAVYGARPLKRVIQSTVETALAQKIIAGEIGDGERLVVDVGASGLTFERARAGGNGHAAAAAR